jgi:hypothetical protein
VFGPNGNLFVSSQLSNQVLEYNGTTGAFVTAFVAAGSGGLSGPRALVFGPNGNLFVSSQLSNQVLEYNGTTGAFITAFVTTGSGGLSDPTYLTFTPVPEPATLNMVVVGAVAVLGYARHRRLSRG